MFTIIGSDGKEYGPVSADQVRAWIAEGRANQDTKVKPVGSAEWKRVGDFPDLVSPTGAPPPPAPLPDSATFGAASAPAPVVDDGEMHRGRRLGARALDWLVAWGTMAPGFVIIIIEFVRLMPIFTQGGQPSREQLLQQLNTPQILKGLVMIGCAWFFVLVVQIVLLSLRGQSIGKLILGLRVVEIADGKQAGFLRAWLLRECLITIIGSVVGVVFAILPIVGIFARPGFHITDWCLIFRADGRCLHDLIAGTRVVKA